MDFGIFILQKINPEAKMWEQAFGALTLSRILIALAIVIVFCGLALFFRFFLTRYLRKIVERTRNHLDNVLISTLRKPLVMILILAGLYIAVLTLPREADVWLYASRALASLLSLLGIFVILTFFNTFIKWYRQEVLYKNKNVGFSLRVLNICWIIVIIAAIWLAIIATMNIWGLDTTKVTGWLGEHGWRIALIVGSALLAIVSMGEIVPRILVRTLNHRPDEKPYEVKKRSDTLSKVLISTLQIFIFLIAIFMILSELQIDIAPILASAGVVGIAIGFGAQSTVKDIVAGLFVIIENHYRVGDVIKVADVSGTVENINLRRTVLRDVDGIVHVIPNGEIRVSSNYTKEWARVNLNISVGYGENLERVIAVINKVGQNLAEDPKWKADIIKPPQVLRVNNFGDSGIEIKILGDTQPIQQWAVTGELRLRLKNAFDAEGIEIPWPHSKMYFGNTPLHVEYSKAKKAENNTQDDSDPNRFKNP
jgi:moderate conductance mechanosensitive channel